jgi:hypothetical protein
MTPQERQLVADLFDRLAQVENAPRDAEAERAIRDELQKAPNAVYALVQTVLVQDEALKRANTHIQELEAQLGEGEAPEASSGGFLGSMRDRLLGREDAPRGSVPSVRPGESDSHWGQTQGQAEPDPRWNNPQSRWNQGQQVQSAPPPAYGGYGGFGGGGSFLGTAASAAAGVIGGSLLLGGIRSMFGHSGSAQASAFDPGLTGGNQASPWGGNDSNSNLAREAGLNDIGQSSGQGFGASGGNEQAGLFDAGYDNSNDNDYGGDDSYDDSDDFGGDDGVDT